MIPKELEGILVSTPDTLSGAVRFADTRVPVQALLDTLAFDGTLDDFLVGFPDVSRAQAQAVIRWEQGVSRTALGLQSVA
jgi:uncharacterized protein (DUF433 family)